MIKDKQCTKKSDLEEEVIEINYKAPSKPLKPLFCYICGKHFSSLIAGMCYECFIDWDE